MAAFFVLLINFSTTLFMAGLVWFVQLVHYPLFQKITHDFVDYEMQHKRLTSGITAPVMLVELATTIMMWFYWPSYYVLNIIISLLLLIIWLSTFFVQIPLHEKLCQVFDHKHCKQLVKTNWIRTVSWSLKALVLAIYFIEIAML